MSCLGCGQVGTPSTVNVPTGIYLCAERCVPAINDARTLRSAAHAFLTVVNDRYHDRTSWARVADADAALRAALSPEAPSR